MALTKRKVNLTINDGILDRARSVCESRGESLSQVVEDFLAKLVSEEEFVGRDWLEAFHKRYLPPGFKEPSDEELKSIRLSREHKYK